MMNCILQIKACWVASLSIVIGCSTSSIPMSNSEEAKQLVATTLNQWSEGKNWSDLTRLDPPVYMAEDIWRKGWQLREYKIDDTAEMVGTNVRVTVNLRCDDKQGKSKTMSVRYFVTTLPALTITREEK